ncbi:atypical/ABC1/ABC1-C protein kinase [Salpingoeca rosetta]|uniref:Atypical/ABC1/ABC1-C protein kinase n=1 Tax=Salpingoeca rosetta (strain ATCC 50818 / BSB-021) TaxID=946362 RepID=F2UJB4_SALR5|nr:atypical/ABC1/ABC1-C protein kinase [Salpingoeca rosetta]EGD77213.1 atypical/ABC1/ABC1-C protein kinase [Salpingoeca rosetta]|eukprot:XP_004990557.1 atypical/ABC1/ABC1-C protein kinase [Salpingoeca rosetta]
MHFLLMMTTMMMTAMAARGRIALLLPAAMRSALQAMGRGARVGGGRALWTDTQTCPVLRRSGLRAWHSSSTSTSSINTRVFSIGRGLHGRTLPRAHSTMQQSLTPHVWRRALSLTSNRGAAAAAGGGGGAAAAARFACHTRPATRAQLAVRLVAAAVPIKAGMTYSTHAAHGSKSGTSTAVARRKANSLDEALRELSVQSRIVRGLRVLRRIIRHLLLFTPVVLALPIAYALSFMSHHFIDIWWEWVLWTVQVSGPAFIKFVQWASSRRDLFDKQICDRFAQLHASVRKHPFEETKKTLTAAFGDGWDEYLDVNGSPVGSGCVAQVYRATLTANGEQHDVAVKVIHPYVQRLVLDDIEVLRFIAWALELIPALKWTSAVDSVEEYSKLMITQLDLRNEARNMLRFYDNFKRVHDVTVPLVLPEFVSENVLIETYEEGTPISSMFEADMPIRRRLARRCVEHFFRMMFDHNFVHGDLHPGNLRVKGVDDTGEPTGEDLQILLLDGGIATELSYRDRVNFVDLFSAIIQRNGREAGQLMLERTRLHDCPDPEGFVDAIDDLIRTAVDKGISLRRVRIGELLQRVLSLMCTYRVKIESNFTSIMIGIMVAEGVGRSLDPEVDLMKIAGPILLREKAKIAFLSAPPDADE